MVSVIEYQQLICLIVKETLEIIEESNPKC